MPAPSSPAWLAETLDVVERRPGLLRAVVGGLVVAGLVTTALAPGVLPPQPVVGAAVALAAVLIGLGVTIALDAGDALIRGPRHVRAAGGELVGVLPGRASAAGAGELASAVLDARSGRRVVLGLTATGRGIDVGGWSDALGVAIAQRGASVLVVDLASGASPHAGLLEVVRDGASLGHTVTFERDVKLARLGAGRDLDGAVRAAAQLPSRLPKDLEVLLVALPPLADRDVLAAAGALDAVLLVARSDLTPRVRLQAGIAALENVGTAAQVVLVDDRSARTGSATAREAPGVPAEGDADAPAPAAVSARATQASTSTAVPEVEHEDGSEPEDDGEDDGEDEREDGSEPDGEAGGLASDPAVGREAPRDAGRPEGGLVRLVRDPSPPGPVGDPAPPIAERATPGPAAAREPEVVAAAAAARLASQLEDASPLTGGPVTANASPELVEEPASEVSVEEPAAAEEPAVEEGRAAADERAAGEPVADGGSDAPVPGSAAEQVDEEPVDEEPVDPTDELPAVRLPESQRMAEDDLRTTAQLALLMDELQDRGDAG